MNLLYFKLFVVMFSFNFSFLFLRIIFVFVSSISFFIRLFVFLQKHSCILLQFFVILSHEYPFVLSLSSFERFHFLMYWFAFFLFLFIIFFMVDLLAVILLILMLYEENVAKTAFYLPFF